MLKPSLLRCLLFTLLLCLPAANVSAQKAELEPPPLPDFVTALPPDPESLESPPSLEWEPLKPEGAERAPSVAPPEPLEVLPPDSEVSMPMPPPAPEADSSDPPSPAEIERITPRVEIWHDGAKAPQTPARNGSRLAQVFVTGNAPVRVWLQFDPLASGKEVIVTAGRGITLEQPELVLEVQPTGDCFVSVQLDEGVDEGHLDFYCEGLSMTLSLSRATPEAVAARENLNVGSAQ